MPYVPLNLVLDRPLHTNAMINVPYPMGKSEGYFFAGYNHTMSIDGAFFRCPRDFIISAQPDYIVLTWRGEMPIPSGSLLNIQLDAPGGDFFFDQRTGVTIQNMVPCSTFLVNLGSPLAGDTNFYIPSTNVTSTQALRPRNQIPDCARNVVITSDQDDSVCTFTIEGEDVYGRGMLEKVQLTGRGSTAGKKAFYKLYKVTPSHPCNGKVSIGTGNKLGLPMFLPSAGFLIREIINGSPVAGGFVVGGETSPPSATTHDCRGVYTPQPETLLDGKNSFYLLFALPNPGNIGMPDYTG